MDSRRFFVNSQSDCPRLRVNPARSVRRGHLVHCQLRRAFPCAGEAEVADRDILLLCHDVRRFIGAAKGGRPHFSRLSCPGFRCSQEPVSALS